jgi:hypothetical protein
MEAPAPSPRFAGSADSPPRIVRRATMIAELVRELETALPRMAANACHAALNRALRIHRDQVTRLAGH